jgi:type I restriction enzyme M protein
MIREEPRYSLRVPMERIEEEGINLNISRYVSTAVAEKEIDLSEVSRGYISGIRS